MSWQSDETGRPLEEGGHARINISANLYTREVFDKVENTSKFVEYCIEAFTQPKWIAFHNPEVSVSDCAEFVNGAVFEFVPRFSLGNAVLRLNCFFDYCCDGSDVLFRITVNGKKGLELVEHSDGSGYSCSHVYSEGDLGFRPMVGVFRGKDRYVFKFQFRAIEQNFVAHVKDVWLHVQVVENPLLNDFDNMAVFIEKHKI
jgi:hypothetical protein